MRLLLVCTLFAVIAHATDVTRSGKPHRRGEALLEVAHQSQHHSKHHTFKVEPCYPPPCPGYEYNLGEEAVATTASPSGSPSATGKDSGIDGGNKPDGTGDGNTPDTPGGTGDGSVDLPPATPDQPATQPGASTGGASGGAPALSSSVAYFVQVVYPPPDPKSQKTDSEAGGCCNPTLEADRKKALELQKKIDAQTALRLGHVKWIQDALDAIAKVQRQILATNETVFELTQDITVLEEQVDQINRKIRADILKSNLEDAQERLAAIKSQQADVAVEEAKLRGKESVLAEKAASFQEGLNKLPKGLIPEVVADQNAPDAEQ